MVYIQGAMFMTGDMAGWGFLAVTRGGLGKWSEDEKANQSNSMCNMSKVS